MKEMDESAVQKSEFLPAKFTPQTVDFHMPKQFKSKDEMKIIVFEFLGMALFSYGIVCSRGSDEYLAMFFFASVCLAGPFSGGHINPAVTLGMLFSRRINIGQAILYWIAQFSGAFAGACACYLLVNEVAAPTVQDDSYEWIIKDLIGEGLATFVFVLFILIQTSEESAVAKNVQPLTNYFLVAIALYISRGLTYHSGGCINPGMAVSLELFAAFRNGDRSIMQFLWIFVAGPFGGGFVASIFYEAIYKRLVKNL